MKKALALSLVDSVITGNRLYRDKALTSGAGRKARLLAVQGLKGGAIYRSNGG